MVDYWPRRLKMSLGVQQLSKYPALLLSSSENTTSLPYQWGIQYTGCLVHAYRFCGDAMTMANSKKKTAHSHYLLKTCMAGNVEIEAYCGTQLFFIFTDC